MNLKKDIIWRSEKYLRWVKSLPCSATMQPADDSHHIKGNGFFGGTLKPHDLFTMPLTRGQHTEFHNDPVEWQKIYGPQSVEVLRTIDRAIRDGVIEIKFNL